jgi:hypothetical protein
MPRFESGDVRPQSKSRPPHFELSMQDAVEEDEQA